MRVSSVFDRSRRVGAAMAVGALAVVSLPGCSGGHSTAGGTTTTVAPAATTTTTTLIPQNLAGVIETNFPATYVEEPAGVGVSGPLDLAGTAAAVNSTHTDIAQNLLQTFNFQRAYQQRWIMKGLNRIVLIRVQLFATPANALGYFNEITFADKLEAGLTTFSTSAIPDSAGFTQSLTDSKGARSAASVDLTRGPLFFHISIIGARGTVLPSAVVSIATAQSNFVATLGIS